MRCPNDQTELSTNKYEKIIADTCDLCGGVWLNKTELDAIEDPHFDVDGFKGSLIWQEHASGRKCPDCGAEMISFNYRLNDLELELCPNKHGWWLDSGEVVQVEMEMEERKQAILRKLSEEVDWEYKIEAIRSKSVIDDLVVWLDEKMEDVFKEPSHE